MENLKGSLTTSGAGSTGTITLKPDGVLQGPVTYSVILGDQPTGSPIAKGGTINAVLTPSTDGLSCTVTSATAGDLVILVTSGDLALEVDVTVTDPNAIQPAPATVLNGTWSAV